MTNQVIPAEAVEAAAKAVALNAYNKELDAMDTYTQVMMREDARAALEAAATHILAGAKADALEEAADDFSVNLTAMSGPRIRAWLRAKKPAT